MNRSEIVDGPKPKHVQLRDILRRLAEQELPPGSPIPSERDLAERYRVSRITVRAAVGQLVAEGLLTRAKGRGTFTARRRMDVQLYLESFTDDMRRRGLTPATEVLRCAEEVPPPSAATALGLPPREPACLLVRLRRADGAPLVVERGWYNPRVVPDLPAHDLSGSLYTLIADSYGVQLDHARQTVWAEGADQGTARLLGVRPGSPLLVFRRVSSSAGRPVEDMTSWYRGDSYQVTMQLDRTTPDSGPYSAKGGTP
ncbi:GntR family transcriptional regulator [Saccharothrix coeruleofusca]|uniref:GntR family transcriptional regulator n=1 Tax=Saccharothrix coeruleofusca TaxID=33919 RepID=A0A918ANT4_9PSEU|nr:GntR family transcriptional regulator [Saccharothrix coeruleofusca]MBP2337850.1 GntR family transcriptional regulator [Saccharothrix coeruleofusca]GGP62696.1 GntR family transcriptional regulator [Saccharothrix coeruleofusca]